jgi:hypothetical protein
MKLGTLNYTIYRGDYSPQYIRMFSGTTEDKSPIDLLTIYDDIAIQIRKHNQPNGGLVKSFRLSAGTLSIIDSNKIVWDLTLEELGATFFYDIRFKLIGTNHWVTYVEGRVTIVNNKTQV